jgi:hypothetical protein
VALRFLVDVDVIPLAPNRFLWKVNEFLAPLGD